MTHRLRLDLQKLERDSHDVCSSCGRPFAQGATAHSGYDSGDHPLYVGDCCASKLAETAVRTYWMPRPYELPPDKSSLWRYLDLAKFVSMLGSRALHFTRADHLGDSWEGAKGAISNNAAWDAHFLQFFQQAMRSPPPGIANVMSDAEIAAEAQKLLDQLASIGSLALRTTYVSCWHENEIESEALWRLYCPPSTTGVAIRSTFAQLRRAFDDDLLVRIGRVRYLDFRNEFADVNDAIFRKRKSLQHEQEVRAVIRESEEHSSTGLTRQIELSELIQEVVISPFAPIWFEAIVREIMERYDVRIPIRTSEILSQPFF